MICNLRNRKLRVVVLDIWDVEDHRSLVVELVESRSKQNYHPLGLVDSRAKDLFGGGTGFGKVRI